MSSGKPEEQQHTDDERDGGTDKSQDEQDLRSALVYATVSPPEITSAAPIKVSCPNFMPSASVSSSQAAPICPPTLSLAAMVRSQHNFRNARPSLPGGVAWRRRTQPVMTGHPQTDQARGIGDGAHVSLSSRPTGMCADGMVDMCRWHGDFAMRYSSGRDPLLIQIALGRRRRLGGGPPLRR